MSKQTDSKMRVFKPLFLVLTVLDLISFVMAGVFMAPTFKTMSGYGAVMMTVMCVMLFVMVAVWVFKILAKISFARSASPDFAWPSGHKKYIVAARLLWLFNLAAMCINVLAIGGVGATVFNQLNLYLRIVTCAVEMIAAIIYLHTVKKLFSGKKEEAVN